MNIAVIFGGESCEHDISIITGVQLINNASEYLYNIIPIYINKNGEWFSGDLLKDIDNYPINIKGLKKVSFVSNDAMLYIKKLGKLKKYLKIDMAFVCLHGQRGEDGSVAGVLEMAKIPYSSSSMLASALSMDKVAFKYFSNGLGVKCIDGFEILKQDYDIDSNLILEKIVNFRLPIIIKPSRQGSSIGIKVCKNIELLKNDLNKCFLYDDRLLIERFVDIQKEVNIALFKYKHDIIFSETEEPLYSNDILGFDEKYRKNSGGFESIKRLSPAKISVEQEEYIKNTAKKIYTTLDMFGVVRFDFIIDNNDNIYLNEVNTIPGSMAYYLFKEFDYQKFIDSLVLSSLIRIEDSARTIKVFDSGVLSQGFDGLKK